MDAPIIDVAFGPPAGDPATLSTAGRRTLQALFRHPIAHNLEWKDVVALFKMLGAVEQQTHDAVVFRIGGAEHRVHKPHSKDITVHELLGFRSILTQAGCSPDAQARQHPLAAEPATVPSPPDLMVTVAHHEARVYRLDMQSAEPLDHVITPYDPHHFLHHLTHKNLSREHGQRAPEDPGFYKRLARTVASARAIVVIGHGAGHSNAADGLLEFLRLHHPDISRKVACEVVADLSNLTPAQLLVLGRHTLSSMTGRAA